VIVVSDTSPILNLAAIGRLDLLHQCYGQVLIPQAVWDEIGAIGKELSGLAGLGRSDWLEVRQVTNRITLAPGVVG